MKSRLLLILIAFLSLAMPALFATSLLVTGPTSANLTNSQSVYLGKIGPGQSFFVLASASTPNATGYMVNIGWDQLMLVNPPSGWSSQPSPLYQNPMIMKVTVPASASYGIYNLTIRAVNVQNYSRLGNITVYAKVNVTKNVFTVSVQPTVIQSGIGQPTNLYVVINNTGISDDPFNIGLTGLPAWNNTAQVVSLHLTQSSYVYPVYVNEPGKYKFNLTVGPSTNPAISLRFPMSLTARESLLNDYSSVGQGAIVSPVIFDPAYEAMYVVSYIYKQIFH